MRSRLFLGGPFLAAGVGVFIAISGSKKAPAREELSTPRGALVSIAAAKQSGTDSALPADAVVRMKLNPATVREIGRFTTPAGSPHALYLATREDGQTCLVEDVVSGTTPDGRPLRIYGGDCSSDVYLGHQVAWTVGSDGGPSSTQMTRRYIIGIAKPEVARIGILLSNGTEGSVRPTPTGSFLWDARPSDLRAGIDVTAITAYSSNGSRIDEMRIPASSS
jgi:hypothetical protein